MIKKCMTLILLCLFVAVPFANAMYDPETGRFLTREPQGVQDGLALAAYDKNGAPNVRSFMPKIQYAADISLYAYVLSRPTMLTDPWGLEFYDRYPNPPGIDKNGSCGCYLMIEKQSALKSAWGGITSNTDTDNPHSWIECGGSSWGLTGLAGLNDERELRQGGDIESPDGHAEDRIEGSLPANKVDVYPLIKKNSGFLRYGVNPGKACRCATCDDIISCINSFASFSADNRPYQQGFLDGTAQFYVCWDWTAEAMKSCCLRKSFWDVNPIYDYWVAEEYPLW